MRILKTVGIALVLLIALVLILGLFISKDMDYEKTVSINAPIDVVWENVNSLSDLDKWSPWNDRDPNMKKEMSGTDGTVGAKQSWESDAKDVGVGSQTITNINAPNLLETKLKFESPREGEADSDIKLASNGGTTDATWGFHMKMPYPFNVTRIFMNMDKMMGDDFDKGLGKLKQICES